MDCIADKSVIVGMEHFMLRFSCAQWKWRSLLKPKSVGNGSDSDGKQSLGVFHDDVLCGYERYLFAKGWQVLC